MRIFKTLFIIIFFLLTITPIIVDAKNTTYSNPQNHYNFEITTDWVEIPKSVIDKAMQQVADKTGTQFINYKTGFQPKNTPDFTYPYILILEKNISTPSYDKIIGSFNEDTFSNITKDINKYNEYISSSSIKKPFVDKERDIIFMNTEINVTSAGNTKGLIAMFLGKESIVSLNFYSLESEYSKNLITFNKIIDSFKYEQGYEYDKTLAKKNDSPDIFNDAFAKGLGGAITGLIFGAIMFMRGNKNKNNKESIPNKQIHTKENTVIKKITDNKSKSFMFCQKCGKKNESEANYCKKCGEKLIK